VPTGDGNANGLLPGRDIGEAQQRIRVHGTDGYVEILE
jgi:hypothetical protein